MVTIMEFPIKFFKQRFIVVPDTATGKYTPLPKPIEHKKPEPLSFTWIGEGEYGRKVKTRLKPWMHPHYAEHDVFLFLLNAWYDEKMLRKASTPAYQELHRPFWKSPDFKHYILDRSSPILWGEYLRFRMRKRSLLFGGIDYYWGAQIE